MGNGFQGETGESVFSMDSEADELLNSLKTAWPGMIKQCLFCLAESKKIIIWAFFNLLNLFDSEAKLQFTDFVLSKITRASHFCYSAKCSWLEVRKGSEELEMIDLC